MNRALYAAALAIAISLLAIPAIASNQAYSCSDASGQFQYDGEQLTWIERDAPAAKGKEKTITSKKIFETLVASSEQTCTTKAGSRFISGSKSYLVVLEFKSPWNKKTMRDTFLCNAAYDSYPNTAGVDTACVTTRTMTKKLKNPELTTAWKSR